MSKPVLARASHKRGSSRINPKYSALHDIANEFFFARFLLLEKVLSKQKRTKKEEKNVHVLISGISVPRLAYETRNPSLL